MEEVTINPTTEVPELTQDWEIDSWRAQTEPCMHQDPGERSSDPTRDLPRLARDIQESQVEVWVSSGLLHGWEH